MFFVSQVQIKSQKIKQLENSLTVEQRNYESEVSRIELIRSSLFFRLCCGLAIGILYGQRSPQLTNGNQRCNLCFQCDILSHHGSPVEVVGIAV